MPVDLEYKKSVIDMHAIVPVNWNYSWYQLPSHFKNWQLVGMIKGLSVRDLENIAINASSYALERVNQNQGEPLRVTIFDIAKAVTLWKNNPINKPKPLESSSRLGDFSKQLPTLMLGLLQGGASLYLQHAMNERIFAHTITFSQNQYALAKKLGEQQLHQSENFAQQQIEQTKDYQNEALGKNKTWWDTTKEGGLFVVKTAVPIVLVVGGKFAIAYFFPALITTP